MIIKIFVILLFIFIINNNNQISTNIISNDINSKNKITIYYFYADWCSYCQKFKPEFEIFIKLINNDNNIIIKTINDCDNKELCNKFNITGFPSIIINYNDTNYIYNKEKNAKILYNYIINIKNNIKNI